MAEGGKKSGGQVHSLEVEHILLRARKLAVRSRWSNGIFILFVSVPCRAFGLNQRSGYQGITTFVGERHIDPLDNPGVPDKERLLPGGSSTIVQYR